MATGRPARSAIAMIFVPLPRLVFPTWSPFFGAGKGAVDEGLAEVQAPARVEIGGQGFQHATQHAVAHPALEPAMTGLIRRIPIGQVLPGAPVRKDPQDAIQDVARIAPGPTPPIAPQPRFRQQRCEDGPLRVSQVHAVEVRRSTIFRSQPRLGIYEIGSSQRGRPTRLSKASKRESERSPSKMGLAFKVGISHARASAAFASHSNARSLSSRPV